MPFPARLKTSLKLDPVLVTIVADPVARRLCRARVRVDLGIRQRSPANPFYYVERRLIAAVIGGVGGLRVPVHTRCRSGAASAPWCCSRVSRCCSSCSMPGCGYEVNGSATLDSLRSPEPAGVRAGAAVHHHLSRGLPRTPQQGCPRAVQWIPAKPMLVMSVACVAVARGAGFRCRDRAVGDGTHNAVRRRRAYSRLPVFFAARRRDGIARGDIASTAWSA